MFFRSPVPTRKPANPRINWGHPKAQGLLACVDMKPGPTELITGAPLVFVSGHSSSTNNDTVTGQELGFITRGTDYQFTSFQNSPLGVLKQGSEQNFIVALTTFRDLNNGNDGTIELFNLDWGRNFSVSIDDVGVITQFRAGGSNTTVTNADLVNGQWHTILSYYSTGQTIDAVYTSLGDYARNTASSSGVSGSTLGFYVDGPGFSEQAIVRDLSVIWKWDTEPPAEWCRSIVENPYQILQGPRSPVPLAAESGGSLVYVP